MPIVSPNCATEARLTQYDKIVKCEHEYTCYERYMTLYSYVYVCVHMRVNECIYSIFDLKNKSNF